MEINWHEIMEFQFQCLKNGVNGLGIPDLVIAQNAKHRQCEIYSLGRHFYLMKDILGLHLTKE
jgi:hypothetical protein